MTASRQKNIVWLMNCTDIDLAWARAALAAMLDKLTAMLARGECL